MMVRTQQALSPDGETTQPWAGRCRTGLRETGSQSRRGIYVPWACSRLGRITEIFGTVQGHFKDLTKEQLHDADYAKRVLPFAGEVYMGHLRYSTTGKSGISYVHPFLRRNNWRAKNLALCGNFNMTNVDEIFARITAIGQHPRKYADTYIMLEQLGHRLDREVERLFNLAEAEGLTGMDITHYIETTSTSPTSCAPRAGVGRGLCDVRTYRKRRDIRRPRSVGHPPCILVSGR